MIWSIDFWQGRPQVCFHSLLWQFESHTVPMDWTRNETKIQNCDIVLSIRYYRFLLNNVFIVVHFRFQTLLTKMFRRYTVFFNPFNYDVNWSSPYPGVMSEFARSTPHRVPTRKHSGPISELIFSVSPHYKFVIWPHYETPTPSLEFCQPVDSQTPPMNVSEYRPASYFSLLWKNLRSFLWSPMYPNQKFILHG